jgi:hypothetical protein
MLIRMGGGAITPSWGPQGNPHREQLSGWGAVSRPPGSRGLPIPSSGFVPGNQPRRKPAGQAADRNKSTLHPELLIAVRNERDQRRGEVSGRGVFRGPGGRVMQDKLATE